MQAARGAPLTGPAAAGQQDSKPGSPTGLEVGRPRRRVVLLVAVALAVLALDIVTKTIIVATLSPTHTIRLLGGFLHLRQDRNPGAAFSFAPSLTILFSLIAITVIVVILRSSRRIRSTP